MPSIVAYSHKATKIWGSIAGRPGRPSTDRMVSRRGVKSSPWTNSQTVRARCSGANKSSKSMAGSRVCRSAQRRRGWGLGAAAEDCESSAGGWVVGLAFSIGKRGEGRDSDLYPYDTLKTHSADVQLDYFTNSQHRCSLGFSTVAERVQRRATHKLAPPTVEPHHRLAVAAPPHPTALTL